MALTTPETSSGNIFFLQNGKLKEKKIDQLEKSLTILRIILALKMEINIIQNRECVFKLIIKVKITINLLS